MVFCHSFLSDVGHKPPNSLLISSVLSNSVSLRSVSTTVKAGLPRRPSFSSLNSLNSPEKQLLEYKVIHTLDTLEKLQSSSEFLFAATYPGAGGVSGTFLR